ncbi:Crp/Fnr family transcriptional regulator [Fibrobacter sp.]|uniref:Crp/Fnr family transcriptional regulator n=1 Tax=Fibrobacter sp. TaxID=35828 RepID=UPI0026075612|nr:Crp/Fnr family transcriptional regulator [Fibrobacter sp.]MDD5942627.1 Crp/Fnr family transcriptional regulator [Fibrobacter sp.]
MDNNDICGLLKGVDLFSELTEEQLGLLANLVVVQDFNRDETVVLEGDCSMKALYLIASGTVQVYMTGVDGRETILSFLERGDFFGEMSLIDGEPRSASVRTVTDAQLMIIHREPFLTLIRQTPEIAMSLLSEMCKRLRKANKQIGSLSTMSVSGRVAGTLLNLMEERGMRIHTDNGQMVTVIHNRPTQQQLADMSGTTRETVSRICSMLVKANAIAMTGKDIVIFDENALQEKATKG